MAEPRRLVAGNWKMNGLTASLDEARALAEALRQTPAACRVALFPPALLIGGMTEAVRGSAIEVGAQDCGAEDEGAFTGDLAAPMLREAGASMVILGHSERRTGHCETDALVAAKVEAALRAGLEPIVCVGESEDERDAGHALQTISSQVKTSLPAALEGRAFSVAYEPIWAIGSGRTPTPEQVEEVHARIHEILAAGFGNGAVTPVLYGGSVKPDNAAALLAIPGVDGALVGGASLKAADFLPIVRAG